MSDTTYPKWYIQNADGTLERYHPANVQLGVSRPEWNRDIEGAPRDGTPVLIEYKADGEFVPSGVAVVVWADRLYRNGAFREPKSTDGDIDVCLWWPESHVTGWIPIPS